MEKLGQTFDAPVSETPLVGSTEEWEIVNLTMDTHPIHIHLINFQIKDRQIIDNESYQRDWLELNGGNLPFNHPTKELPVTQYLIYDPIPPKEYEIGWKDTIQANPGEVTRLLIRFAPEDANEEEVMPGVNLFPFNPCIGPNYMWHCHILDHEDNEMMRPMKILCNNSMCNNNTMS